MFSIVDYEIRYSPYDKSGGALKNADWVKLPAKPRGEGLGELLEYKRGLEVFAIWCLLLEKTTNEKPENRGKLLNHKEQPATIEEITKGISLKNKTKLVEYALTVLLQMNWVSQDGQAEVTSDQLPTSPTKSRVEKSRVEKSREGKEKYLDFVFLTKAEYRKLVSQFGVGKTTEMIAALNDYIGSKGRQYKSHYHTILSWQRKHQKEQPKLRLFPIAGKTCSKDGCKLPAVYKDTSGSYDNYSCEKHLPTEVKELYGQV